MFVSGSQARVLMPAALAQKLGKVMNAIVNSLNAAIHKVVALPEAPARFKADAVEAAPGSPCTARPVHRSRLPRLAQRGEDAEFEN